MIMISQQFWNFKWIWQRPCQHARTMSTNIFGRGPETSNHSATMVASARNIFATSAAETACQLLLLLPVPPSSQRFTFGPRGDRHKNGWERKTHGETEGSLQYLQPTNQKYNIHVSSITYHNYWYQEIKYIYIYLYMYVHNDVIHNQI